MDINTHRHLARAYEMAVTSPDKSNQNGAVIMSPDGPSSFGHNHFYPGVPPTDKRPEKYERIVHAEADACLQMARYSWAVCPDTVMYCPWATCKACAIAILGSGIPKLVIHYDRCLAFMSTRGGQDAEELQNWQPDIDESAQWLRDGGCEIEVFKGSVPFAGTIQINGRPWSPMTLEFTDGQ